MPKAAHPATAARLFLKGRTTVSSGPNTITKSITIAAPFEKVFFFLINPMNWTRWAIVTIQSIVPGMGDWWDIQTPLGSARLRMRSHSTVGVIDHEIDLPRSSWKIATRVLADGEQTEFVVTFFRPDSFTETLFRDHLSNFDKELQRLKHLMEIQ